MTASGPPCSPGFNGSSCSASPYASKAAMTLDTHLRAKRLPLTVADASQFFSADAVTSNPLSAETVKKPCAEHFPICAKYFGKGEFRKIVP